MKKIGEKIILFIIFLILFSNLMAESDTTTLWTNGGFASLVFNQISLTNWAKGGESSLSSTAFLNLFANYKKGSLQWDNSLDLGYGIQSGEELGLRKNEDKIDLNSKIGFNAFDQVFYTALFNFKTQFTYGYNYPNDSDVVSKFFAPAYLIISIGLDYKPAEYFSVYLSPATGRIIFVLDQKLADQGAYGVDKAIYDNNGNLLESGKTIKPEFGAYLKAIFKKDIFENVNLESKLALFNNYTDKDLGNRKNIDVDWETNIVMKINKFISANIILHLIYDENIKVPIFEKIDGVKTKIGEGSRLQIKQVFGLGFSYKF